MGDIMLKIYIMPDGRKYQFDEDHVPAGAVLAHPKKAEKKTAEKAAPKSANKAKKPANNKKKAAETK